LISHTSHTIQAPVETHASRFAIVHKPDDQLLMKIPTKMARKMLIAITPPSIVIWKFRASLALALTRALRSLNAAMQMIEMIGIKWLSIDHMFSSLWVNGWAPPPAGCCWYPCC